MIPSVGIAHEVFHGACTRSRVPASGDDTMRRAGTRSSCARFTAILFAPLAVPLVFATSAQADRAGDGSSKGRTDSQEEVQADDHAHEHRHEEHTPTETIVVTGTPLVHDRDELAIPVERIDREELILNLGSTLGETLSQVPGVATTGFAGGASRPVIRGQDAYRTEVLEDGLRTQDVSRESPDHAVPVNPLAAQRVEIVRGPATLRYGGGASAGVVNVITHRIPDRLPDEAISGEIFGGIGLVANERDLAARLDGAHGALAWHADGMLRTANNYSIPNDSNPHTQAGTSVDSWMGSLGGAWIGDVGRLGFSYVRAASEYGIPEESAPVEIDQHTDRFRFEGDLESPAQGIRSLRVRGVYSDYEHDEKVDGDVGQTYRNEEFEGRLEMLHEPVAGFTGALGLQGGHRDFRGEGEAAEFLAPAETTTVAVYVFEERTLMSELDAEFGFRVEHTNVDGRDITDRRRDKDFVPVSGSLGLVGTPFDWLTIGLTGTVSQRAPAQVELLARGAHEATATFEIGDPELDMETAYAGDLRIALENARGRLELSSFVTRYDDFIFAALTGNEVDEDGNPAAPGDDALDELIYRNRDAVFYGTEISGSLDLVELPFFGGDHAMLGIDGRFDFVRARFASDANTTSRDVPRITPIRWGSSLFLENEAFEGRVGFVRTEPQSRNGEFETPTKSYTYLNASLAYRVEPKEGVPIELTVVARNLLDVRGRNAVAFNKDEVLLPGRAIRFGLRTRF